MIASYEHINRNLSRPVEPVSACQDEGALTELPAFLVEERSLTDILQSRLILPAVHIETMNSPVCV